MRLNLRNQYFSQARYNRYLISTGHDINRAKKLYLANIRLAQAFHPILSQFEVVLRNSLNDQLSTHFANQNWIKTEKNGFMNDPSLGQRPYLKGQILSSERRMRRNHITITSGKLIADQTLGFWIALFSTPHYKLLLGKPIQILPNKPSIENRASFHQKLQKIRHFRNRVNHCEPLCFSGNIIDCSEAIIIRTLILDLASWINPGIKPFFAKLDNVHNKINYIMTI